MRLKGKNIVITGASSGMGRAMTALFVSEGANIVAVARRKDRLEALRDELSDKPGKVIPFSGDISLEQTNIDAIDTCVKEFGSLDVLVNNAGVMDDMSPIGDVKNETIEKVFAVNVYGPMYAMRKAINVFLAQGNGGNIINVASVGAFKSCAGAVYCASKAAVVSLTKNTAFMYMPNGIRCNGIAPGGIKTEISTSMGVPNMAGYDRVKRVLATSPELGEAEQVANAALFLASDESSYISGDIIALDGGWLAG